MDIKTPQTEIKCKIIRIETKELKKLNRDKELIGLLYQNIIKKILASDKAELRNSQKVIASSSSKSTSRNIELIYLFDAWTGPSLIEYNRKFDVIPPESDLGGQTDIGTTLTVTPCVVPDNHRKNKRI